MVDTQITELAGRHYLISQLLAGGVEVATPLRDRGIDLIVYLDRTGEVPEFLACPVQLKANQDQRFGVERKYEHIPNLLMVYAWKVFTDNPELYALTYAEVVALLHERGHTQTKSWNVLRGYSLNVNATWRDLLAPYRMQARDWLPKVLSVCGRASGISSKERDAKD